MYRRTTKPSNNFFLGRPLHQRLLRWIQDRGALHDSTSKMGGGGGGGKGRIGAGRKNVTTNKQIDPTTNRSKVNGNGDNRH